LISRRQANIHSLLETDERVAQVIDSIDDVIAQLDTIDAKIASYKIQLNVRPLCRWPGRAFATAADHRPYLQAVSDDISYIESQNRGLQVQTSNQKALLAELENLLVRLVDPARSDLDSG
jgi:hypothetical protein